MFTFIVLTPSTAFKCQSTGRWICFLSNFQVKMSQCSQQEWHKKRPNRVPQEWFLCLQNVEIISFWGWFPCEKKLSTDCSVCYALFYWNLTHVSSFLSQCVVQKMTLESHFVLVFVWKNRKMRKPCSGAMHCSRDSDFRFTTWLDFSSFTPGTFSGHKRRHMSLVHHPVLLVLAATHLASKHLPKGCDKVFIHPGMDEWVYLQLHWTLTQKTMWRMWITCTLTSMSQGRKLWVRLRG